jgi:prophage maintenance system killer protein
LNGWKLSVDPDEGDAFLRDLLSRGECDFAHLQPWLRGAMREIE